MKYIDLHLHLDGSITVEIAKKLAALQNIKLPTNDDKKLEKLVRVPDDCKNLVEFLKCFELPLSLMQTKEGLEEATFLVLEDMKKAGNIYVELRYAPQLHCQKKMSQEDAIKAVLKGAKRSSLKANIILCLMRGENNEEANKETVELAKKYLVKDGGVVAVDLAGAESIYPTSKYRGIFTTVKNYNIPFTIHSGESEGPDGVKLAIEYGASRIGHGVRIREDKEVLELVKEKGITLELCPTSNIQTCSVKTYDDYPLINYLENGIKVTINSDDPAIEGTNISREHSLIEQYNKMSKKQQLTILNNSIDAAFTTDKVKNKLRKQINGEDKKEDHKKSKGRELVRFLICGLVAALFDYLACQLIVFICGNALSNFWTIALSTMVGFIVGVITNYIISILWVYQNVDESINKKSKKFIALFVLFSFIGMLLSIGTMYLCELTCISAWGSEASIINTQLLTLIKEYGIGFLAQPAFWRYFIAFVLKTLVGLVFNYFTRKFILFKEPKES